MAGTEKTGKYEVLLVSKLGRVGVRFLGGSSFRLRVEPANPDAATKLASAFTRGNGYKQPGDGAQQRFSNMGSSAEQLKEQVTNAVAALNVGDDVETNPDVEARLQPFVQAVEKAQLIRVVRWLKVPGCNLAALWSLASLRLQSAKYDTPDKQHARLLERARTRKFPGLNKRWKLATLRAKLQS